MATQTLLQDEINLVPAAATAGTNNNLDTETDDGVVLDLRSQGGYFDSLPSVTVVIPTKNEAANLAHVLPLLPTWIREVVIVDAQSTDGTCAVAQKLLPGAVIIVEPRRGKGVALRTGFEAATSDVIVALDADGSADPREIPALVGALVAGADLAKGTRFLQGGGTSDMELHRMLGNWALTRLVNVCFNGNYSDLCYGFFALRKSALGLIFDSTDDVAGFEIETFINVRALKARLEIREVPSIEYRRIEGVSNLNAFLDGLRILRVIAKERFGRKRSVKQMQITGRGYL